LKRNAFIYNWEYACFDSGPPVRFLWDRSSLAPPSVLRRIGWLYGLRDAWSWQAPPPPFAGMGVVVVGRECLGAA